MRVSNDEIFRRKESGESYKSLMVETGLALSTIQNIVIRKTIEKLKNRVLELETKIKECEDNSQTSC